MEGANLGVSSAGTSWFGNIAGRGGQIWSSNGGVFVGMNDEFVFAMDTPIDRN
jgi:hypothetical protein